MFTAEDLKQFEKKNISPKNIEQQIENFRNGFPYINLIGAATPENGIRVLDDEKTAALAAAFEKAAPKYSITKMVPASGAASRMFKSLYACMEDDQAEADKEVTQFLDKITDFAFYPALTKALAEDEYDIGQLLADGDYRTIIRYLLTGAGLDCASLPKGLLFFHSYPDGPRTPLEEHMAEGLEYSKDQNNTVHLHFTVSPEHKERFIARAKATEGEFIQNGNIKFDISWSEQKPSTDTIAVDMDNIPFRNADGSLLFRPGGHGALIENLNDLDADIAFIKNIDNVVPDKLKQPTYLYKKVLGGLLIDLMERSFRILASIESGNMDGAATEEAITFAREELNIHFPKGMNFFSLEDKRDIILDKLNRPIRICGMVKNEGEPGGGPFRVTDNAGNTTLQVVESAQIDMDDEGQQEIIQQATHFNPVDLVCSLKDYNGNKFNLKEFVDPQTGLISVKSKDGRELKAQELPGLWNGAMANWITIFVEVPIETFNPVKTVTDLLRPQHQ
ncbi:MAG: DUF4301 family protein [Bacteroidales bacterium]|nr:DUF4301 family protein [Bacteroidales bacterium]